MRNMSLSKMRSSRMNIDRAILVDFGIICGVAVGYQYAVRPLAKLLSDQVGVIFTNLHGLRIPSSLQRRWHSFLEAYRMHQRRGSLVRTIAYYVPFLPPTPRVAFGRYWNDDEYESVLAGTALSNFRKFFRDDTYSESEDDTECGAAGLIYDFGPEADDLTEQFDDSRIDQFGSTLWGTTDMTYNFEKELFRPHPTCSTPSLPRKFDPLDDLRSVSEVSECNAATQAKVAALESELSEMRVMIAKILAAQNGGSEPTPTFRPQTDSSPTAFIPIVPQRSIPPPPPLPPPPMPTVAIQNATRASIKLKVGNVVNSPVPDSTSGQENTKQGKLPPTNIIDVLKDLPSVKLRSVAKSPGGTPLRQPRTPNMNDPASMIAAALKNRFAKMHSPGPEVELWDDDFDDKENEPCAMIRDENDGFSDVSPARPRSGWKRGGRNDRGQIERSLEELATATRERRIQEAYVMIPFSSSMLCSRNGRRSFHQLCIVEPAGLTLNFLEETPHGIQITVPDCNMKGEKVGSTSISSSEWILLETLDCRDNRPLHTGPFLTVQRRRRRRKYVRTYLFKDPTLIDDLSVHQTNFVLDRINSWAFNAFILDNVTGGRPLPILCVHLFKAYGLLEHFDLDPVIVWKLFSIIEDGYHWRNPYHNGVHAADVTQAMHCFLQENMILSKLTPLEIFSAILAAVTHDLDHPGVNQPFLIATSNHLAALYKNSSVLENHHWRSAMGCLNESGVSNVLGPELVAEVERQIKSLVLATDITRQQEFLSRLKEYLDTDTLDMEDAEVRHFFLQIALKCADISNPCRPWEISRKWSLKVCEEFFRQGDYERQLNLPVTALCDRYTSSVPKIQTGFYQFVVRPLFTEWHRMLETPLSTYMMDNLDSNKKNWDQLLKDEIAGDTQTEVSDVDDSETPMTDTEERGEVGLMPRSVRFDPLTTITTASDSETSDDEDEGKGRVGERGGGFLGIPGHPARDRRHSIATGLMGNIQLPPSALLSTMGGISSQSGSTLSISELVASSRTVGRTVIRRESLPGTVGRTLPTKTILHLQRLSAKQQASDTSSISGCSSSTTGATAGSTSPGDFGDTTPAPASPVRIVSSAEKSSCSSCSTTDEILDFTYSLPETGSRSSGSPRRILHEATDLDELCPGTSILSMSPNVAHVTLQQSADLEDQRRHLIRQQTCPVVSVTDGSGNFNRPRFLSAAAAVSPTAVASSSIITQHRSRNRSPETGEDVGRCSGGSSSEALICCEVISEEGDRQSGGSSAEASPLEIFVQQFPPVADDNDGEAPRRESLDQESQSDISYVKERRAGSMDSSNCSSTEINKDRRKCSVDSDFGVNECDDVKFGGKEAQDVCESWSCYSGDDSSVSGGKPPLCHTFDSSTQTDISAQDKEESVVGDDKATSEKDYFRQTSNASVSNNNNRLATILMWRNKRLWKSLTEDENEDPEDFSAEERRIHNYYYGALQQQQQGSLGNRLQSRRGSAPTTGPAMGCRGAQDRRSDPTQYHSNTCLIYPNSNLISLLGIPTAPEFLLNPPKHTLSSRRGSAPVDLRQSVAKAVPLNPKPSNARMGRRGSLPVDPSNSESSYAYKWMHVFPYNEDDGCSLKRRSSGGPELFAAAAQQNRPSSLANVGAWKAQIFIENCASTSGTSPGGYWPGKRRGSLPIDVSMASSGSCTSESESSSGDASDT